VLLRTGWGTREKAYELGIDYYKRSPSVNYDAAMLLATKMAEMGSSIFMTDCGLVNPPRVQGNDWFRGDNPLVPLPKPWPSAEARERVLDLGAHRHGSSHPSSYGALIKKNRPRVVPTKAGTQNPHYISPFAKGETKRGSRIQARIRELGRNDGSVTE
jgi:hypothetical protein